jgi:hypothetical protein
VDHEHIKANRSLQIVVKQVQNPENCDITILLLNLFKILYFSVILQVKVRVFGIHTSMNTQTSLWMAQMVM